MKKKLENLLSILIIMLILPLLVTIFMQKLELESLLDGQNAQAVAQGNTEDRDNNKGQNNSESRDSNQEQNNSESRDSGQEQTDSGAALSEIEQTLPRIVANEINVNAEPEAVRAQCVIARTNCVLAEESGNAMPEALSLDELTRLWGQDKFNEMYQKLEKYVQDTQNQVLEYEGKTINAEYHAVSSGQTRNIAEAVGEGDMPYLSDVVCKEDISAKGYLGVYYFSKKEFYEQCGIPEEFEQVQIGERDAAGYVLSIKLGENEMTGEEFREKFELPSPYFSIQEEGKKIRIVTKGIGHGYGLSQNTAQKLAEEGKTYVEILNYFFQGTELVTLTPET